MKTKLIKTSFVGLLIVEIDYFVDERGFFIETWHKKDFAAVGINLDFVQDSHSRSSRGVLRGMHYQDMSAPMAKLIRCTVGTIFDVAVDLRASSKTFGKWYSVELTAENKRQFLVPVGFAHGFSVLSDVCEVQYKQTGYYTPSSEGTIGWNDPDIGIKWPIKNPMLSARDSSGMTFRQYQKNPSFK